LRERFSELGVSARRFLEYFFSRPGYTVKRIGRSLEYVAMSAAWFAGRLRELREGASLTRQELADRAGLKLGGVRDIEQGKRIPSWETVLALCDALDCSSEEFRTPPGHRADPKPGRPPKTTPAMPPAGELAQEAAAKHPQKTKPPRARKGK
jgi:transcriptional regulator with XRE-family HTH domain